MHAGTIDLPALDNLDDASYTLVWALADSGSAAHVADMSKAFPGANVRVSPGQKEGVQYAGAGGQLLPNKGEAVIPYLTSDGQRRATIFQNAAVGMPILSISKITDEDNIVAFHKRGGYIQHISSNAYTPIVKRLGVYFVQLRVPKQLVHPVVPPPEDFHRPEP